MSEKKLDELIIAVKELTLQNEEKERRAAELIIANKELAFQNQEKERRAAELIIANKELDFQNQEKEKRAAELLIANKNLAFQYQEKVKRAAELIIANKELDFQNEEKEKRAKELIITNKKLVDLLQLNADKDLFISILAHDLRSPFNALIGLSDLLLENLRTFSIDEIEVVICQINKSALNNFALLEDLLKWARMQSGKIIFNPQKLDFTDICKNYLEILKPNAFSKNITINCFDVDKLALYADIDMFKSVFRNIVSNAIKFTNNGGQIDIYARKVHGEVIITISDNGIGMSPKNIARLFDISQIQTTTGTDEETGSGLGLVLCKEFVEKQGGKIWVESVLGRGSNFSFTIPAFLEIGNEIIN